MGPHKKSSERDTHSAVSSSKQAHQHGLFVPMQNMRQNVSEKVAQVCARHSRFMLSLILMTFYRLILTKAVTAVLGGFFVSKTCPSENEVNLKKKRNATERK